MKRFVAIYIGTHDEARRAEWDRLDPQARAARQQQGIAAWTKWGEAHAGAIVDDGSPLGKTKRASAEGITDTRNAITGYTIVEAESHEAAARMFADHPHFAIFPGDSVEIMECLPIPSP
jgi:hypothetical protein